MAHNTIGIKLYAFGADIEPLMKIVDGDNQMSSVVKKSDTEYTLNFLGLQEIGEIGFHASVGSNGFDKIEVTTLADTKHQYINGLVADTTENENNELGFKFLYDAKQFKLFQSLQGRSDVENMGGVTFYIELPDGTMFGVLAYIKDIVLDTLSVGSAMTYSVNLAVNKMEFANGTTDVAIPK